MAERSNNKRSNLTVWTPLEQSVEMRFVSPSFVLRVNGPYRFALPLHRVVVVEHLELATHWDGDMESTIWGRSSLGFSPLDLRSPVGRGSAQVLLPNTAIFVCANEQVVIADRLWSFSPHSLPALLTPLPLSVAYCPLSSTASIRFPSVSGFLGKVGCDNKTRARSDAVSLHIQQQE